MAPKPISSPAIKKVSSQQQRPTEAPPEPPVNPSVEALKTTGDPNNTNEEIASHEESPEKLSLKARLKLFEKEIQIQGSAPAPVVERKFSFLNPDELAKMKEEEGNLLHNLVI